MTTIATNRKLINDVKKNNVEPSLLNSLKISESSLRIGKLPALIKHCTMGANQLKAVLFLFSKEDRYEAFKLLVKHFDINLSVLNDSEINQLTVCLAGDPAFDKLLPFKKKNFGILSPAKQNAKKLTSYLIATDSKSNKNNRQNNSQLLNKIVNSRKSMLQELRLPPIKEETKFSIKIRQSNSQLTNKKISFKESKLQDLRLSLLKKAPTLRLNFFKYLETKEFYQSVAKRMSIEEFKNFIEIFPPNDAIKFLNLPFIRDQIEGLQQQNGQISKESFIDLLNYFKPYQKDSVMKQLRPISTNIDTKLVQQGIFKEKIIPKAKQLNRLPDIVTSHNHYIVRTR